MKRLSLQLASILLLVSLSGCTTPAAPVGRANSVADQDGLIAWYGAEGKLLWQVAYPPSKQAAATVAGDLVIVALNSSGALGGTLKAYQTQTGEVRWVKTYDSPVALRVLNPGLVVMSRFTSGEGHYGVSEVLRTRDGALVRTIVGSYLRGNGALALFQAEPVLLRGASFPTFNYRVYDSARNEILDLDLRLSGRPGCGELSIPVDAQPRRLGDPDQIETSDARFISFKRRDRCGRFTARFDWTKADNLPSALEP